MIPVLFTYCRQVWDSQDSTELVKNSCIKILNKKAVRKTWTSNIFTEIDSSIMEFDKWLKKQKVILGFNVDKISKVDSEQTLEWITSD